MAQVRWQSYVARVSLLVLLPTAVVATTTNGPGTAFTQEKMMAADVPDLVRRAEAGDPDSQFALARAYLTVRKNRKEAERWLVKASAHGHALASYAIGQLYADRRDYLAVEITLEHFQKAAEQGYPFPAFDLGKAFASRLPPPPLRKDDVASCSWFLIASALDQHAPWNTLQGYGLPEMRKELPGRIDKARQSLTPDLLDHCERRAADWLSAHPPGTKK